MLAVEEYAARTTVPRNIALEKRVNPDIDVAHDALRQTKYRRQLAGAAFTTSHRATDVMVSITRPSERSRRYHFSETKAIAAGCRWVRTVQALEMTGRGLYAG